MDLSKLFDDSETLKDFYKSLKTDPFDLFAVSINVSALFHKNLSINRYCTHIDRMAEAAKQIYEDLIKSDAGDSLALYQHKALKTILYDQQNYQGDQGSYDSLENMYLNRVIDRRKGIPVAISILYMAVAKRCNWTVEGLNMPGHFVLRLREGADQVLFDPFHEGRILQAHDLRQILKSLYGNSAELSADYYKTVGDQAVSIRLFNNIKLRLIEKEDYLTALKLVELMREIDSAEYRLLLDAGILYMKNDMAFSALPLLENYVELAPNTIDRMEALQLIDDIKSALN